MILHDILHDMLVYLTVCKHMTNLIDNGKASGFIKVTEVVNEKLVRHKPRV